VNQVSPPDQTQTLVRLARRGDLDAVMAVDVLPEAELLARSWYAACLRDRNVVFLVGEVEGTVVLRPLHPRPRLLQGDGARLAQHNVEGVGHFGAFSAAARVG
jgi:hypothetical protein